MTEISIWILAKMRDKSIEENTEKYSITHLHVGKVTNLLTCIDQIELEWWKFLRLRMIHDIMTICSDDLNHWGWK
jgi:hypothetical protein